jgi:beta-phosphoglucomutase
MTLHPKAFLFDLNGTMIDDMPYHISSWHQILNKLGAELSHEQVKHECYGKNHELLERIFPGRFTEKEKDSMSLAKEDSYQSDFRPHLKLIDGLGNFLKEAKHKQIKMAIGSAAIQYNIDFVLDGLDIRHYFDAIISADDVKKSKPDAETYLKCAQELRLYPWECVVFEDSPKGVEAAANAGMKSIVITTMSGKEEFAPYDNIISYITDYNSLAPAKVTS